MLDGLVYLDHLQLYGTVLVHLRNQNIEMDPFQKVDWIVQRWRRKHLGPELVLMLQKHLICCHAVVFKVGN